MKKKMVRLLVMAFAVVMVFAFASTAFAGQTVSYNGKCVTNFFATSTLTKINDTTLKNTTWNIGLADFPSEGASCDSKIYIAGTCRSSKAGMQPTSTHVFTDTARRYTGTCQVQLLNNSSNNGRKIYVIGDFAVY